MTVFYRKYRPQKLADLIGQEYIKETLLGQLLSGKISHGYLFAGPKGTGKTSTARILAKAVNCTANRLTTNAKRKREKSISRSALSVERFSEPCNQCQSCLAIADGSHLDLIEIDAASNRGIDEIRDLREKIKLSPLAGRFKVYIIDEVHMLTTEAFNALLKTLEEPPSHAIFILCTTDAAKLPATIISRLQRFNFSRAAREDLISAIEKIVKSESLKIEKEAILAIAEASDGSFRDAISILDQVASQEKTIELADVSNVALLFDWNHLFEFVEYLANYNLKKAVGIVDKLAETGVDIAFFTREVILFLKKLLFIKIGIVETNGEDATQIKMAKELTSGIKYNDLVNLMKLFLIAGGEIKLYPLPQIPLILAVCKYCGDTATTEDTVGTENTEGIKRSDESKLAKSGRKKKTADGIEKQRGVKKAKSTLAASPGVIDQHWAEFLSRVKDKNVHVVALLRSTKVLGFDGSDLTLEVFYRFHKDKLEEPKIREMLEDILSEVTGKATRLKFVLAQKESKPTAQVELSDVVEPSEELAKIAQEIFSK